MLPVLLNCILIVIFCVEMQQHRPDLYNHLTQGLDADHQNNIMNVIATAEKARNDLATL